MAATVPAARRAPVGDAALVGAVVLLCAVVGLAIPLAGPKVALAPLVALAGVGALAVLWARPAAAVGTLVVLLTSFPVARVSVGPIPAYFLDGLLAFVLLVLVARRAIPRNAMSLVVAAYLASWVPALVYEWLTIGAVLEPLYGFIRHVLAVCMFFVGLALARSPSARRYALLALTAGTLVTCVITLLQVLPPTAALTRTFLETLAPSFAPNSYLRYPARAFAFFQAPTTLAGFLTIMLVFFLGALPAVRGGTRRLMLLTLLLVGPALIATYSRQWVPAVLAGLLTLTLLRPQLALRGVVVGGLSAAFVLAALTVGSLDQTYLTQRFSGGGGTDDNLIDRLAQPGEFLAVQAEADVEVVTGRGFAGEDLIDRGEVSGTVAQRLREGLPTENSILLEVFNHGIVAGLLLVAIVVAAIVSGRRVVRARAPGWPIAAGLTAALATAAVLAIADAYLSQSIFMKALLWMLIGWVFGLRALSRRTPARSAARRAA
ncbi:MAG TPA: hypothetical protein VHF89_17490 [Solirubrobacteraceae bacterium]|nr:hypothetical protein [Solirubrobacteraceae bacterium]